MQVVRAKRGAGFSRVVQAIKAIMESFHATPFHNEEVIEYSYEMRKLLNDYIDRVVVATAMALEDDLITEDRRVHLLRGELKKNYRINIYSYTASTRFLHVNEL